MAKVFHRIVTPQQLADQYRGAMRLGPGVWLDHAGSVHFNIPELLAHFEIPDTPESREQMMAFVEEQLPRLLGGRPPSIIRQEPES